MKLKKIASLALAGVMALSMLAGCANNGSSNNNGGDTQVTTTNVITLFQNAVKSYNSDLKITFKDNSQLNSAIMTNDDVKDLTYSDLTTNVSAVKTVVASQFKGSQEASSFSATNFSDFVTAMSATTSSVKYDVVFLDGTIAGTTMLNKVANDFAAAVKDVENEFTNGGKDYAATYTMNLFSAEKTDAGKDGKTGTLLVIVLETEVEEVK